MNISSLRNVCNALLITHSPNLINDEEFLMLCDLSTSKNPDFPYRNYQQFDLEFYFRASERNSAVVGSNSTQANFL